MNESSWQFNRKRALQRDRGQCQSCGLKDELVHVHHKTPRSKGGTNRLDNLVTLCPQCHADRHDGRVCQTCGSVLHDHSRQRSVYDKSGATMVDICDGCFEQIRESATGGSCTLCESRDATETKHNAAVAAFDGPDGMYSICDRCREVLVFDPHSETLQYFSETSPVDFRHWEDDTDE